MHARARVCFERPAANELIRSIEGFVHGRVAKPAVLSCEARVPAHVALCFGLVEQTVLPARSLYSRETEFAQMHTGDQKPLRTNQVQKS